MKILKRRIYAATTETYRRGSSYSADAFIDSIMAYDETIDYDKARDIVHEIAREVNRNLPSSYVWYPDISEIHSDIDETIDLSDEEFDQICHNAFEKVMNAF